MVPVTVVDNAGVAEKGRQSWTDPRNSVGREDCELSVLVVDLWIFSVALL